MADEGIRASEYRPRLGRGLAALLGDDGDEQSSLDRSRAVRKVPVEFLRPNPRNPRRDYAEEELDELAASIRERGVIQPVLVRAIPKVINAYEIIAGERRWRATQRAGQHEIPILVLNVGDRESLELALIENVQRTDLNALEEANGYAQLAADHGYSHADIARIVGKSRSHIANTLRLSNLPEHTRALLASGAITAGHARALLSVSSPDAIADQVVARGMTVRDVERLGENSRQPKQISDKAARPSDPDTRALEKRLGLALGTGVSISRTGDTGYIKISYRSYEQLDDFCRRLTSG